MNVFLGFPNVVSSLTITDFKPGSANAVKPPVLKEVFIYSNTTLTQSRAVSFDNFANERVKSKCHKIVCTSNLTNSEPDQSHCNFPYPEGPIEKALN